MGRIECYKRRAREIRVNRRVELRIRGKASVLEDGDRQFLKLMQNHFEGYSP